MLPDVPTAILIIVLRGRSTTRKVPRSAFGVYSIGLIVRAGPAAIRRSTGAKVTDIGAALCASCYTTD